jgi:Spy/CpxP family protein refolding chaperone
MDSERRYINRMKKWIIGLIVVGLIIGGGFTLALTKVQAQTSDTASTAVSQTPQLTGTNSKLTDTQKQQLQDLAKSQQESNKALQDQLQTARQQLKDALVANPTDTAKLQQAQSQILSLEDQLATSRTDFALKAKEITGGAAFGPMGPGMGGPEGCGDRLDRRMDQMGMRMDRMGERLDRLEERLNMQDQTETDTEMEQPPFEMGQRPDKGMAPDLFNLKDELGITDAQVTQLKDLRTSTASSMQQLRNQMQTAEKDLRDAIQADPTDTAKLQTAQTTLSNLRAQQLQAQINVALQVKQIVGPDIFAKAVDQFGRFIDFFAPFGRGMGPRWK